MAKGDAQRVQDQIDKQGKITQDSQNNLTGQLNNSNKGFQGSYDKATGTDQGSYDQIMKNYQGFYDNPYGPGGSGDGGSGGGGVPSDPFGSEYGGYSKLAGGNTFNFDPEFRGAISNAIGGYNDFAKTGGFSDQNIQDLRARAIAPTRAIYGQAQDELNRGRSLNGGGSNFNAAQAKMAREMSNQISDQNVNADASIAQAVQQGKLAGNAGLVNAGGTGQGMQNDINSLNGNMMLAGLSGMTDIDKSRLAAAQAASASGAASNDQAMAARLAALSGMTGLFGTTPGMMQTTGDQLLNSNGQLINNQQLQMGQGQNMVNNQLMRAQVPGNGQQALSNIGKGVEIAGRVAGAIGTLGASEAIPAVAKKFMQSKTQTGLPSNIASGLPGSVMGGGYSGMGGMYAPQQYGGG